MLQRMDIAATAIPAAAPKPAFESLEGALKRLSAAEINAPAVATEPAAQPPRFSRKGQTLDVRV
jgi:hypothetical protein